jgi:hypothetical protein
MDNLAIRQQTYLLDFTDNLQIVTHYWRYKRSLCIIADTSATYPQKIEFFSPKLYAVLSNTCDVSQHIGNGNVPLESLGKGNNTSDISRIIKIESKMWPDNVL